jgi:hypothetical protein
MVSRQLVPLFLGFSEFLRDAKLQAGDGHVLGVAGFLSSLSGQYICPLVAGGSLVALDPYEIYGFPLAAEVADCVSDAPGHSLAWSRAGVSGSRDRARGVGMDGHVAMLTGGRQEPLDRSLDGG